MPYDQTVIDAFNNADTLGNISQFVLPNGTLNIPCGVEYINGQIYRFSNKENIKQIIIPDSVKNFTGVNPDSSILYFSAFSGCTSLVQINIPDSITQLQKKQFSGCTNLQQITLSQNLQQIYQSSFESCTNLKQINLPQSLTFIDERAFYDCESLTQIQIPYQVLQISKYVFYNCVNLQYVEFQGNVTTIQDYAFYGCKKLLNIPLSQSLTLISNYSFGQCESLISIILPVSVQTINAYAFGSCELLQCVQVENKQAEISQFAFYGTQLSYLYSPQSFNDSCPVIQYQQCIDGNKDYSVIINYEKYCINDDIVEYYVKDEQNNNIFVFQCPEEQHLYIYKDKGPQQCVQSCPKDYKQKSNICDKNVQKPLIISLSIAIVVIVILIVLIIVILCKYKNGHSNSRSNKIQDIEIQNQKVQN